MKAELLDSRDVYNVNWGAEGSVEGATVRIVFENQADGDKSVTTDVNDGNTTVVVDKGWRGVDTVTVQGSNDVEGNSFSFEVEFAG